MTVTTDNSARHGQNEGRKALASAEAAWNAAARPWNAAALAAVYTADAMLFGGRPGHSIGAAAIRNYFASYDGVILSGSMELLDQQIAPLATGVVLAQGFVDFSFDLAGNQSTKSHLRTTLILVQHEGQWRIRQHHFSATPTSPPLG